MHSMPLLEGAQSRPSVGQVASGWGARHCVLSVGLAVRPLAFSSSRVFVNRAGPSVSKRAGLLRFLPLPCTQRNDRPDQ
jgi:hypothetical protein